MEDVLDHFEPRTELGKKLVALRAAIILSGVTMLDDDEIAAELADRRGGLSELEYSEPEDPNLR
jgi:hypothetical protein